MAKWNNGNNSRLNLTTYTDAMSLHIMKLLEENDDMFVETAFMHIIISGKHKYKYVMNNHTTEFLEKITDLYPDSMLDLGEYRILKRLIKKNYFDFHEIKGIAIRYMMSRFELQEHSNLEEYEIDQIIEVIEEIKQRNEN